MTKAPKAQKIVDPVNDKTINPEQLCARRVVRDGRLLVLPPIGAGDVWGP